MSRVVGQAQYNLTCRADQVFPRPALALFRYRAGPLEQQQQQQLATTAANQQIGRQQHQTVAQRPRLAATLLRQEPIAGVQTQLLVGPIARQQPLINARPETDSDLSLAEPNEIMRQPASETAESQILAYNPTNQPVAYEISAWALVDEATLSSNVVTQFECLLSIEGTGYEQRHSLALQRGK